MHHSSARKNMELGQLLTNEILDAPILRAMDEVPREDFLPKPLRGTAYTDKDLPVGGGRFLLAPMTFAKLLLLAGITPEERVLVVGALSGYAAAVAAKLASHVVAVEDNAEMVAAMREHFARLNIRNADAQAVAALPEGYALSQPYDAIVVCGGVRHLPEGLLGQLSERGRLVAVRLISRRPDSPSGMGRGVYVQRDHKHFYTREHFDAACALLPGFGE